VYTLRVVVFALWLTSPTNHSFLPSFLVLRAALDARGAERGPAQVPVQVGAADVESEGPSRAAGGGLVDRLPVRGAFVAFLCVCSSVPALSWGQYRLRRMEQF
jgi:hypothetical protein